MRSDRTATVESKEFDEWWGKEVLTGLADEGSEDSIPYDDKPYLVTLIVPQGTVITHGQKREILLRFHNSKLLTRFLKVRVESQRRFIQCVLIAMNREYAANAIVKVKWTKAGKIRQIHIDRSGDEWNLQLK